MAEGGKLNAYKLFLAKSTEIQKNYGLICEIFQNSFLADNSAEKIRKYFIQNQKIISIDSFPERDDISRRVFENVKMSVCILISLKRKVDNYNFLLTIWNSRFMNISIKTILEKKDIMMFEPDKWAIPLATEKEIVILKKLSKFSKLKDIARCYEGEINLTFHKKYLSYDNNHNSEMIKGAAVQRYFIKKRMSQGKIEYLDKDSFLKENSGPKTFHFMQSRIIMQGITGVDEKVRLKVTMIGADIFCGNSVNYVIITNNIFSPYFILSLLNSTLLNWFFKIFSTNSNVNTYEVHNLPIPYKTYEEQKPFIDIVNKIFKLTNNEDYMENEEVTRKIEVFSKTLDEMIFELYLIPKDDIKVILADD